MGDEATPAVTLQNPTALLMRRALRQALDPPFSGLYADRSVERLGVRHHTIFLAAARLAPDLALGVRMGALGPHRNRYMVIFFEAETGRPIPETDDRLLELSLTAPPGVNLGVPTDSAPRGNEQERPSARSAIAIVGPVTEKTKDGRTVTRTAVVNIARLCRWLAQREATANRHDLSLAVTIKDALITPNGEVLDARTHAATERLAGVHYCVMARLRPVLIMGVRRTGSDAFNTEALEIHLLNPDSGRPYRWSDDQLAGTSEVLRAFSDKGIQPTTPPRPARCRVTAITVHDSEGHPVSLTPAENLARFLRLFHMGLCLSVVGLRRFQAEMHAVLTGQDLRQDLP